MKRNWNWAVWAGVVKRTVTSEDLPSVEFLGYLVFLV
jgi:hypothetical protein